MPQWCILDPFKTHQGLPIVPEIKVKLTKYSRLLMPVKAHLASPWAGLRLSLKFHLISCHLLPASCLTHLPFLTKSHWFSSSKGITLSRKSSLGPSLSSCFQSILFIILHSADFLALKFCLCPLLFLSVCHSRAGVGFTYLQNPRNPHGAWHIEDVRSIFAVSILNADRANMV